MNALIAIIPIALLFVLMLAVKMPSHRSALVTLLVTVVIGLFVAPATGMIPEAFASRPIFATVGFSVILGMLKAVFPILIIILMAIFSYNILVESGKIEVIKNQFTSFTDNKGILVLMMVWGFGGLLEGMAGFGTAVAIPAAILIGLGFKPVFSALVALLGNTVATGFGAVGVPVITLANEVAPSGVASHQEICEISAFSVLQLSPLFILIPFAILMLTDHRKWLKNILLSLWVGGISVVVQYFCALYLGAETPAILGSIAAILAIIIYIRIFEPKKEKKTQTAHYSFRQTLQAWSVYILILVLILGTGALYPPVNNFLKSHLVSCVPLPAIDSTFRFGWISNAGLMLFIGSVAGGYIQGLSTRQLARVMARTVVNLRFTTITIISLISIASVMSNTGMIAALAAGLVTITGSFYPLFAPLIGAIGTFVTGSDTSSNILFGKLQADVASRLRLDATGSNWLVAANTTGATGGKMISPQSIAIATAACDMKGKDDTILRKAIPYALVYILIGGLLVWLAV